MKPRTSIIRILLVCALFAGAPEARASWGAGTYRPTQIIQWIQTVLTGQTAPDRAPRRAIPPPVSPMRR